MAYNAPALKEWIDIIQEHDLSETKYVSSQQAGGGAYSRLLRWEPLKVWHAGVLGRGWVILGCPSWGDKSRRFRYHLHLQFSTTVVEASKSSPFPKPPTGVLLKLMSSLPGTLRLVGIPPFIDVLENEFKYQFSEEAS